MEIHSEIHSSEQFGCYQIDESVDACQEIVRSAPKVVNKLSLEQLTQLGSRIDVGKVRRLAISRHKPLSTSARWRLSCVLGSLHTCTVSIVGVAQR
jgi:hypothetical protein